MRFFFIQGSWRKPGKSLCSNPDQVSEVIRIEAGILTDTDYLQSATVCPNPCSKRKFIAKAKSFEVADPSGPQLTFFTPSLSLNSSSLISEFLLLLLEAGIWLYYSTTDVTVWEDYHLFDLNDILSALGGSLGLFVGFSCLDVGRDLVNYFRRFMKKMRV